MFGASPQHRLGSSAVVCPRAPRLHGSHVPTAHPRQSRSYPRLERFTASSISGALNRIEVLKQELEQLQAEFISATQAAELAAKRSRRLGDRSQQLQDYALEHVMLGDEEPAKGALKQTAAVAGALEKATQRARANCALAAKLEVVITSKQADLLQLIRAAKQEGDAAEPGSSTTASSSTAAAAGLDGPGHSEGRGLKRSASTAWRSPTLHTRSSLDDGLGLQLEQLVDEAVSAACGPTQQGGSDPNAAGGTSSWPGHGSGQGNSWEGGYESAAAVDTAGKPGEGPVGAAAVGGAAGSAGAAGAIRAGLGSGRRRSSTRGLRGGRYVLCFDGFRVVPAPGQTAALWKVAVTSSSQGEGMPGSGASREAGAMLWNLMLPREAQHAVRGTMASGSGQGASHQHPHGGTARCSGGPAWPEVPSHHECAYPDVHVTGDGSLGFGKTGMQGWDEGLEVLDLVDKVLLRARDKGYSLSEEEIDAVVAQLRSKLPPSK